MRGTRHYRQLSTILAALRVLQDNPELAAGLPHFDDCDMLTGVEIDRLCEQLNFGTWKA